MISINQFKNGMTLKIDGELYQIAEFQHVKPGKGAAFVRTKLRKLKSATSIDRTFRDGEKFEDVFIENRPVEYLYRDASHYVFMDQQTFEQFSFDENQIGRAADFLTENMLVTLQIYEGVLIDVVLPASVNLRVASTGPGLRGDTAKAGTKPATLETGLTIQVPLFVNMGDVVKVDTRTREYLGRA